MKPFIAIVCLAVGTMCAQAGEYADISVDDLDAAIKAGKVTVLDVNRVTKFSKGHIPGAIHFPSVKDLSKVLPEDKDALIVAYCGGPRCKAYQGGANAAAKLGYKNVKHLSAGISGWKKAGKAVETPKAE